MLLAGKAQVHAAPAAAGSSSTSSRRVARRVGSRSLVCRSAQDVSIDVTASTAVTVLPANDMMELGRSGLKVGCAWGVGGDPQRVW